MSKRFFLPQDLKRYRHMSERILYFRRKKKWSRRQLAEYVKASVTYAEKIENPNVAASISLKLLFRYAEVLQVSPGQLLDYFQDPELGIYDLTYEDCRQKARELGKAQAQKAVICRMLKQGMKCRDIARLTGVPFEETKRIERAERRG